MTHFESPKPIPVTGVVDATIWLTVAEAAVTGEEVALITANSSDFAPARYVEDSLHPDLIDEIRLAGGDPNRVKRYQTVAAFNNAHVEPSAEDVARQFLADNEGTVLNEIADAVEWLPITVDADWELGVDIDESVLAAFDARKLELLRADESEDGFFMTLNAFGEGRLDLGIWKHDAVHILDDSPVKVYDFDHNESIAAAEAELALRLAVEVRVRSGNLDVTVEDVARA